MPNNTALLFKGAVALVAIIAIIWLTLQVKSCTGGSQQGSDTLSVKRDTVWKEYKKDTQYIPQPYAVTYYHKIVDHDTIEVYKEGIKVDTGRILEQYFATRHYDETLQVQYGSARLKDTVTQNRITGRSIILTQDIPFVKETVTMLQPKRVILYFSIGAIGNRNHLPYASGAGLGLKLKNDAMIEGMGYLTGDAPMFGASIKIPIRLRKQR